MDFSGALRRDDQADWDPEQRSAPRYASLIRAAKLVSRQGEFVCVIRDVSASGVSVRSFHGLPADGDFALELQNGEIYELETVRTAEREASFRFAAAVEVEKLIHETWNFPKRQLRLNIALPLVIATLSGRHRATTENVSQQGAKIECEALLAIDQTVRIEADHMPEIRAKVRWRRESTYGLVFDNTFSLRDFAIMAAAVQCPSLLADRD